MPYKLGKHSLQELEGVHPRLIAVVERSIQLTTQDYTVFDGLRFLAEQKIYVETGVSQTLDSKHLPQLDGYGHAVDLIPYINGKLRWEIVPMYPIALSMRQAAEELGAKIRWGGCWQVLTGTTDNPKLMVEEYIDRRRRQGRDPFVDGPHFELVI